MEITNFSELWRDLVQLGEQRRQWKNTANREDKWHGRAKDFEERINQRWKQKDSSRAFVLQTLKEFPDSTVLDIGSGSGAWASLMAAHARSITAIDPSASMLEQLHNRVEAEKLENVEIIQGCWPEVTVQKHDICFCSHAMYGVEDFSAFVAAMQKITRKRIILLIRAPQLDGLMAQAAQLVWGHPFDSPNYQIAMNILWEMKIFPNVIMEATHLWKPWSHPTIDEALLEMKSRLGLLENNKWDQQLLQLLKENLKLENQEYYWPAAMRTALMYWDQ